jgi:hypothetical protein
MAPQSAITSTFMSGWSFVRSILGSSTIANDSNAIAIARGVLAFIDQT